MIELLSEEDLLRARTRLAAGRVRATELAPYLSSALYSLIPREEYGIETFAVDAFWRMYYHPRLCLEWTVDEIAAVWLHEVNHVIRDHVSRASVAGVSAQSAHAWNAAADAVINSDLQDMGVVLPNPDIRYYADSGFPGWERGLTAEQLYAIARPPSGEPSPDSEGEGDSPDAAAGDKGDSSDPGGSEGDAPDGSPEPGQDARGAGAPGREQADCGSGADGVPREWDTPLSDDDPGVDEGSANVIVQDTARSIEEYSSMHPGTVPGGLEREAGKILRPHPNGLRTLRVRMRQLVGRKMGVKDYSYARPSRRQSALSYIAPSMRGGDQANIYIIVDTSGSMRDGDITRALSEIAALLKRTQGKMYVISCDVDTSDIQRISSVGDIVLVGKGGTDMRRGIKAAAEAVKPRADAVIVITDGGTPWQKTKPRENMSAEYIALIVNQGTMSESVFEGRVMGRIPDYFETMVVDQGGFR